jgi:hypothetical protein
VSIRFPSLCSIEIDYPFVPTCLLAERARCYACLGGTAPRRCAEVIALLFSLADGWEVLSPPFYRLWDPSIPLPQKPANRVLNSEPLRPRVAPV